MILYDVLQNARTILVSSLFPTGMYSIAQCALSVYVFCVEGVMMTMTMTMCNHHDECVFVVRRHIEIIITYHWFITEPIQASIWVSRPLLMSHCGSSNGKVIDLDDEGNPGHDDP